MVNFSINMYLAKCYLSERIDIHKSFQYDLEYLEIPARSQKAIVSIFAVISKLEEMLAYYNEKEKLLVENETRKRRNFAGEKLKLLVAHFDANDDRTFQLWNLYSMKNRFKSYIQKTICKAVPLSFLNF